uniref:Uncharacterized protein n=1 Tax=Daphnia galeata TaxID=27404 RepID=A0A8J2WHW7_9CRUS|nr:unnamed protein product [Daphnia galeata]
MPATTQQLLTIIILKGDGIPSREYTYELSWSFQNISEWKQQQGFHRKYSKEIQFCVKKLNEDRRADVISDYWASPETVWVSLDGGKFEIDGSKKTITRIILKKEECERFLIDEMSIYQLLDLIIWADLHSAEKVKEAALNCARKNSAILFRCYNYEYEKLMRPFLKATRRRMTI